MRSPNRATAVADCLHCLAFVADVHPLSHAHYCRGSAGYYFNGTYNDTQAIEYL